MVGLTPEEETHNLVGYNHSCSPNASIFIPPRGKIPLAFLVTRGQISKDEEITTDYSVSNISNTHRLYCNCGSTDCRKIIQPRYDFLNKDMQQAYVDEFPAYVRPLIDDLSQLTDEIRNRVLISAYRAEQAGAVTLLAGELDKIGDDDELLQRALNESAVRFVRVCYLFGGAVLESTGVDIKEVVGPKWVIKQIGRVIDLARKVDEKDGWFREKAA